MADKMFSETFVPVGGKRGYTVLGSVVAHTALIAAAIMVPVMASDIVVPVRYAIIAFRPDTPLPPQMPPPAGVRHAVAPDVQPSIPVVAPNGITREGPVQATPSADSIELNTGIVSGDVTFGLLSAPPPPPVVEQAPRIVGGDIKPPTKVTDVAPVYPAIARSARVEGVVIIKATIGPDGRVQDAQLLRSIPLLDAAALDAVRQWTYTPTRLNGTPIAIIMTVTVNFWLR